MKSLPIAVLGVLALACGSASAATCVNGVYRAGCAGPNGAALVHKAPVRPAAVHCASGVYRAGCVGPNGAVVTNTPVAHGGCYMRAGVRVCR